MARRNAKVKENERLVQTRRSCREDNTERMHRVSRNRRFFINTRTREAWHVQIRRVRGFAALPCLCRSFRFFGLPEPFVVSLLCLDRIAGLLIGFRTVASKPFWTVTRVLLCSSHFTEVGKYVLELHVHTSFRYRATTDSLLGEQRVRSLSSSRTRATNKHV